MIAVIFEVWPKTERKQGYLNIAADLKPLLEKIDGFISIERFESLWRGAQHTNIGWHKRKAAARFFPIIVCG